LLRAVTSVNSVPSLLQSQYMIFCFEDQVHLTAGVSGKVFQVFKTMIHLLHTSSRLSISLRLRGYPGQYHLCPHFQYGF
jgi:hypothetical protein